MIRTAQYAQNMYRSVVLRPGISRLFRGVSPDGARVFIKNGSVCAGQETIPGSARLARNYLKLGVLDFNVSPDVSRQELSRFSITGQETENIRINISVPPKKRALFATGKISGNPLTVLHSKWGDLLIDQTTLPSGIVYNQINMDSKPFACVLPVLDDGRVMLQRQFRPNILGGYSWEIPAGGIEENEDFCLAAERELAEEMGFTASQITQMPATIYNSNGRSNEFFRIFLARGLNPIAVKRDDAEYITDVRDFSLAEAVSMIARGDITDSCTAVAVLYYAALERGK